jgi:hypothetical protein
MLAPAFPAKDRRIPLRHIPGLNRLNRLVALVLIALLGAAIVDPGAARAQPAQAQPQPHFDPNNGGGPPPPVPLLDRVLSDIGDYAADGVVLFALAMLLVVLHLRNVLAGEPRWVPWILLLIVAVAAALRVAISREAPMNAWPYERVVPLARRIFEGPVLRWISTRNPRPFYLTEVIFKTDLVIASVTPLVFFAHARYVLRDVRAALVAAGILAVLPNHIHFSRADSEFVQSLATSSLTFVMLYTALRSQDPRWRALSFVLLPLLSTATYFVRPENMVFYPVDIGAILLTSGPGVSQRRRVLAFAEVTAAAIIGLIYKLFMHYRGDVEHGLSMETLRRFWSMIFDRQLNTLINPSITPPGLTLLAVVGAVLLYRRERHRAVFLVCWLVGFFLVHSYVRPSQAAMQARYHMHLITPLLLLAASAVPNLIGVKWLAIPLGLYLAASPLLHLGFERDTRFNEMQEFAFLRGLREAGTVPDDCTVLEFSPAVDLRDPHAFASRWHRMAFALQNGAYRMQWPVVSTGRIAKADGRSTESLTPEVKDVIAKPPECLMVYEGLSCQSHKLPGQKQAPMCAAMHEQLELEPIAQTRFMSRVYDEVNAGRVMTDSTGRTHCLIVLHETDEIPLTLYRARARGTAPLAHQN